jgi:glycosyltransferase involved in cell wall biosynthesis
MKREALHHGAKEGGISVIHPWSLFEPTQTLPKFSESLFRKTNQFGDKTLILYSGNHSVVHPLYTLLDAAKRMKEDPSVLFVFVGGGLRSLEVKAFKEKEGLANIVQLPLVPREDLSEALASVNAHVVVMGEAVNGLVHTSKVYGALATGRPILYVGPKQSHVCDLLKECSQTYHAEHGDVEAVVEAVRKIKSLSEEEREKAATENKRFYKEKFSAKKCFSVFSEEVLKLRAENEVKEPGELSETYAQP